MCLCVCVCNEVIGSSLLQYQPSVLHAVTDPAVEAVMKMWPPPNAPSPSAEWTGTPPSMMEGSTRATPLSGEPQSPRSEGPPGLPGSRLSGSHTQAPGKAFGSEAGDQFFSLQRW